MTKSEQCMSSASILQIYLEKETLDTEVRSFRSFYMLVVLLILNNILLTVPLFPLIIILLATGCVLCAAVRDQSRIPNTAHSLSQTDTKETNFKKIQIRK